MGLNIHVKSLLIVIAFCVSAFTAAKASGTQDSLLQVITTAKADTNKVNVLNALAATYYNTDMEQSLYYGEQALALAEELKYKPGIMRTKMVLGRYYSQREKLPEAMKCYHEAHDIAIALKDDEVTAKALVSLGLVYKQNDESDKAMAYYKQALPLYDRAGLKGKNIVLQNIAITYIAEEHFSEAKKYLQEALAIVEKNNEKPDIYITTYNNMSSCYTGLEQRYDSALLYALYALKLEKETGNTRSMLFTYSCLAKIYMELGLKHYPYTPDSLKNRTAVLATARRYCEDGLAMAKEQDNAEVKRKLLFNMVQICALQRDTMGYWYLYDYMITVNEINSLSNQQAFARMEAALYVQKTTDSLKYVALQKDNELRKRRTERNSIIAVIIFLGTVGVLVVNQKRLAALAEKRRVEELARQQLDEFTQRMHEKNQMLEAIALEIERQQAMNNESATVVDVSPLVELQQSILLTDEQWDKFKNTFDKVYKGYLLRLKERIPDISPAETRFIMLSKLRLSNKEMAGMLGLSTNAIRNNKYRLMKRLELVDDAMLDDLIHST